MAGAIENGLVEFARNLLIDRIETAQDRIWLASPFLTLPIAKRIATAADKSSAGQRRLLTALGPRSVQVGVLDPAALSHLQKAGFKVSSAANLHAKVSLVDSSWGLVGSGNLTGSGLGKSGGGNHELGVILTRPQIETASAIFSAWWKKAKNVSRAEIARYAKLERFPRNRIADLGPMLPVPDFERLEEILGEDPAIAASRRHWVDANYHDPEDEAWWERDWISGQRAVSYDQGDLILVYLGKKNRGPARCPAVLEATSPTEENRRWVIEHRDAEAADRWPNVTKTKVIADAPLETGASLQVIQKTGRSLRRGYLSLTRAQFERLARDLIKRNS